MNSEKKLYKLGLKEDEAREILKAQGFNEIDSGSKRKNWKIFLEVMSEPMYLLLLACSFLYMLLGDYREGLILPISMILIFFVSYFQKQKTEKSLQALRNLSSPRAVVVRGGIEIKISGREVVVGDLLLIKEGDRVAADAKLLFSTHLQIDESLLTGESIPIVKLVEEGKAETIFAGTLVTKGFGIGKVYATGKNTAMGKIGKSLQKIEPLKSRLQSEMQTLTKRFFIIGIFISLLVSIAFYLNGEKITPSILNGLSTSIAILPEEFPVVFTIFLSLGAWKLSAKNVLTRKPSAIENMGSVTVLCCDKTGTLTENKMKVVAVAFKNKIFEIDPLIPYKKEGQEILKNALFASPEISWDPTELAIKESAEKFVSEVKKDEKLIKEFPLSKDLFVMSRVIENSENEYQIFSKGAPEDIMRICHPESYHREEEFKTIDYLSGKGYRIIAVASGTIQKENLPENQRDFQLDYFGIIALEDPVRKGVKEAITDCHNAGIKVIMITGDYPLTAKCISEQIGLPENGEIITGSELNKMSEEKLRERLPNVNAFARVIPEQKLRIVRALQNQNGIVAMTGDGVNDAPALKAADIGIAMGKKGTDVAREASSFVILDDNFLSIVEAIRGGRRIFDNLQKAMSYIVAIHVPIIGLSLLPAFIKSIPILLLPLHIVFLELIIDPVCAIAFESEQEEKNSMKVPPRNPNKKFFDSRKMGSSFFEGVILLSMIIMVYFISANQSHGAKETRAITYSALILGNISLIISKLSVSRSFISIFSEKNKIAIVVPLLAIAILVFINLNFTAQSLFNFKNPGIKHFIPSIFGAIGILFILEIKKWITLKIPSWKSSN